MSKEMHARAGEHVMTAEEVAAMGGKKAVDKYRKELRRQQELDEYVKKMVDGFPLPSPEQLDRVAQLLYGGCVSPQGRTGPSQYEVEQQRKAAEAKQQLDDARKIALSMTACDVCDLQPEAHHYQKNYGTGFHEWVPGRAQKIMNRKKRT